MYVTLEPCCHQGKTPPCTDAIIAAGIKRVVVAMRDPFPQVAGGGLKRLAAAGIDVELGLHEAEAQELNAPYLKLLSTGRPWVIAKWAMTLDGKIATRSGYSQWISGDAARAGRPPASRPRRCDHDRPQDGPARRSAAHGPLGRRHRRPASRPASSSIPTPDWPASASCSHGAAIPDADRRRPGSAGKRAPPPRRRRLRSAPLRARQATTNA